MDGCSQDEHESSPGPRAVAVIEAFTSALEEIRKRTEELESAQKEK